MEGNNIRNKARTEQPKPVMSDFLLQEELAGFVRERIPERVVFAGGAGAYGTFTTSADLSRYTRAELFSKAGNSCRIFARFSSFFNEKGTPDGVRDVRGFAVKFMPEGGVWDLAGQNFPVSFVEDPGKFKTLVHVLKKNPETNTENRAAAWEFFAQNPETLHLLLMLFSGRGIPAGYGNMDGFGVNTFSFVNENEEIFWVKFHLKTRQGIRNSEEENPGRLNFAQSLVDDVSSGNFPKWKMYAQIMTPEQAHALDWNPFDPTRVWPHGDFPLAELGELELSSLPKNYFEEVEKAAFSPTNLIDGIGISPDRNLQARLFAYRDAQRYRLGTQAAQPQSSSPHILGDFSQYETVSYPQDPYTQCGSFYTKALKTDEERSRLAENIVKSMMEISSPRKNDIIFRQLCHFFRANVELGMKISTGLGINIDMNMMSHAGF